MTFFCQLLMTPTYATEVPDPVDGVLTITVQNAGDLYSNYSAADITATGATTLKVIGPLNENDFSRLRGSLNATLTQIDLSEAVFAALPGRAFDSKTTLTAITLPDNLTSISYGCFWGCSSLASINLPSSLTTIDTNAFYKCSALASVVFPSSLTTINAYAFNDCTALQSADLSQTHVTTIESGAFSGCTLLASVQLPDGITSLGSSVFSNCSSLQSFDLSNTGLTEVPSSICSQCTSLTSVLLPATITSIGSNAFYRCTSLPSFTINVTGALTINSDAFESCTLLDAITINAGGDVNLGNYYRPFSGCSALETFELHTPGKVTAACNYLFNSNTNGHVLKTAIFDAQGEGSVMGESAFYYCKNLTSVTLPAKLTTINTLFFYHCEALTSVTIPSTVTSIANSAFDTCTALESMDLSATQVTSIGNSAFSGCTSLASVQLPAGITSLGSSVFSNCSSLQSLDLSQALITEVPIGTCSQCTSLTSVQLPANITSIGSSAFSHCSLLPSFAIDVTGALTINSNAFEYCTQLAAITIHAGGDVNLGNNYRPFADCKALETFELHTPGKVMATCNYLFNNDTKGHVLKTAIFDAQGEGSVMGETAFYYCKNLTSVTLPASLGTINTMFFYHCEALASVTIPSTVTSIGNSAFDTCIALEGIDLSATHVTSIGNSAFSGCTSLASVQLPAGITSIGTSVFNNCSSLQSLDLSQAQITEVPSSTCFQCTSLASVQLPATITSIGSSAFYNCGLTSFSYTTNGALTIGNQAFYNCKQIENVSLTTSGALSIGESAFGFGNNSVLQSVTIHAGGNVSISGSSNFKTSNGIVLETFELHTPGKVILPDNLFYSYQNNALRRCILDATGAGSTIGQYAFEYCRNLEEVLLPAGLVSIGRASFYECNKLESIELPATTVISDGYHMFYNCSKLQSIDLSQLPITALGDYAFSGCAELATVLLPDNFTTISSGMFNGCSKLANFSMPATITSIGQNAFKDCAKLSSVTVPASVTSMGQYAFQNCTSLTTASVLANVAMLPIYTFDGCTSLKTVTMDGSSITTIGERAFNGCSQLVDITLPSGLTTLGQYAFNDCVSLSLISLPATLTTLGNGVFDGCTGLISLEIPEGVSELPQSVFSGCTGMQSLYLPSTITTINYSAFYNLNSLIDLHIQATTPPPFSYYSRAPQVSLFVPEASISAYQAADNWKNFGHIYAELTNLATLDDGEYALLQQIYNSTNGTEWTRRWTFGATKAETAMPYGVKVSDGHVKQIALVSNNLSGSLPQQLMQFPQAWYVNVSRNNFSGDIGAYFDAMSTPNTVLTYLDLSNNQFTGNIGRMNYLSDKLPALTTLKIAYNRISDVKPVLPAHITTLDLRGQEVHFNDHHYLFSSFISIDPANMPDLFPSILTYRHSTYRDYGNTLFLLAAPDAEDPWAVEMQKSTTTTYTSRFIYISTGGWNFLPSGSIVYLSNNERNLADRIRIRMEFDYPKGDIDYNGAINVSDLQLLINFAIYPEGFSRSSIFNWAAANLIAADQGDEEVINVQDVVAEVNKLLDNYVVPVIPARQQTTAPGGSAADTSTQATAAGGSAADTAPQATLSLDGQQLVLTTSVPVAAMHLQFADDDCRWQPALGLMSHRQKSGRHVFYSMSGDQLSAGTHVLAQVGTAQLEYAMLVDIDGKPIRCTIDHNAPTGIETIGQIDNLQIDNCYDLSGRKIVKSSNRQMGKGVYIVDGKKHIVK